jgi:hypothetical protein
MQKDVSGYYSVHQTVRLLYEVAEENHLRFMRRLYDCDHDVLFSEASPFYDCELIYLATAVRRIISTSIRDLRRSDRIRYKDILIKNDRESTPSPEPVKAHKYITNPTFCKTIFDKTREQLPRMVGDDYLNLAIKIFPNRISYRISDNDIVAFVNDEETKKILSKYYYIENKRASENKLVWFSAIEKKIVDKRGSVWLTEFTKFVDFIVDKLGMPYSRDLNKSRLSDLIRIEHQTVYPLSETYRPVDKSAVAQEERELIDAIRSLILDECPFEETRTVDIEFSNGEPVDAAFYGLYYQKTDVDKLVVELGEEPIAIAEPAVEKSEVAGLTMHQSRDARPRGKSDEGKAIEKAFSNLSPKAMTKEIAEWICNNIPHYRSKFEKLHKKKVKHALQKTFSRKGHERDWQKEWRRFTSRVTALRPEKQK